jgi:hypothetical protein
METAAFEKGTSQASKLLRKTQRDFEAMATKVAGIGQKMSLAITAPLVGFGAVALKEANEANAAMAQVNAALKSMGPVAGKTADQLKKASDALELNSLFEGDEILKKVTANLLTFGNISGQAFDRAQQAAVNLSARLGQDLQASAIQVGKALNDPVKGMNALARVGVQFSEAQKETIKSLVETGQTAKAQAIILGELERQFGGAAKAAQDADPYNKATDAFKQMAETVGQALLPIIPIFTNAIVSIANAFSSLSPGMQKFLIIAGGVAAALGPMLVAFGAVISATGSMLPLLIKIGPALGLAGTGAAGAATSLAALGPVLGIVAAGAIAVFVAYQNWDKISPYIQGVVDRTTKAATDINAKLKSIQDGADSLDKRLGIPSKDEFLTKIVNDVKAAVGRIDSFLLAIQKAAADFDRAVVTAFGNAGAAVGRMVTAVSASLQKLSAPFDWVRNKAKEVGDAFATLYDRVVGHSYVPDMVDGIAAEMARLDAVMVQPVNKATTKAGDAFKALQDRVQGILDRLFPENAAQIQFNKDLADLEAYALKAGLGVDDLAAAVARLRAEYTGFPENPLPSADLLGAGDNPDRMDVDTDKMLSMLTAIPQAAKTANDALARIATSGLQTLGDGLTAVIMGTAKLRDVFHAVAEQILADLIRLAIQKYIIDSIFKAVGGFSGGGQVQGFASGGFIRGRGTSTSDSIPALLSNGEFVVKASATKKFLPLLEKINSGAFKFASGGPVRFSPDKLLKARGISNDNAPPMPTMELHFHNDYRGADPASVAAIQARQDQFERELPGQVVRTMNDARQRFIWRDK